ncbi:lysyl-tRNA synthetase [Enterobacter cloacae]|uniref:Lysyl-tRNA synthetase n=1 Tax=Enterobacter cloacae TaxID=550 RepID=A0A377M9L3_ENTCL|nr:lysyl-tRNA synthetase [Enterobacter cloacae]
METPCMSQATVTDIHLVPFETRFVGPGHSQGMNLWLMTSPEYHMKRLLAQGVARCISCAAASVMKRWGVTIIRNSPCWSGTVRITICTA